MPFPGWSCRELLQDIKVSSWAPLTPPSLVLCMKCSRTSFPHFHPSLIRLAKLGRELPSREELQPWHGTAPRSGHCCAPAAPILRAEQLPSHPHLELSPPRFGVCSLGACLSLPHPARCLSRAMAWKNRSRGACVESFAFCSTALVAFPGLAWLAPSLGGAPGGFGWDTVLPCPLGMRVVTV